MAIASQFSNQPSNGALAQVTTANTNRDGTGTVVTIFTAGVFGARIERIICKAAATTTAGTLRFYVGNGSVIRLIHEELVSAIVPSATVAAFVAAISTGAFPLILAPNNLLIASTEKTETFNIMPVEAGNF